MGDTSTDESSFYSNLKAFDANGAVDTTANPLNGSEERNRRVVDMYDRSEVERHLTRFVQHSVARNVNPTLDVMLDYLYGKKTYGERDDFVRIERMLEMVKGGSVFPELVADVLQYALAVERAAIDVLKARMGEAKTDPGLRALQKALALRLEVENGTEETEGN